MFPSDGTDSKENQSVGSTDFGVKREFLQPPHNPDSPPNRLPDEDAEKGGDE
jgi:hypothetical protein